MLIFNMLILYIHFYLNYQIGYESILYPILLLNVTDPLKREKRYQIYTFYFEDILIAIVICMYK